MIYSDEEDNEQLNTQIEEEDEEEAKNRLAKVSYTN